MDENEQAWEVRRHRAWSGVPINQNPHEGRLTYYTDDDGVWIICKCGESYPLGFNGTPEHAVGSYFSHLMSELDQQLEAHA